jgi:hypothetical protein
MRSSEISANSLNPTLSDLPFFAGPRTLETGKINGPSRDREAFHVGF